MASLAAAWTLVKEGGGNPISFFNIKLTDQQHPSHMEEEAAWEMSQTIAAVICF